MKSTVKKVGEKSPTFLNTSKGDNELKRKYNMLEFHYDNHLEGSAYTSYYYIPTYPDPENANRLASTYYTNSCREYFVRHYRNTINTRDALYPPVKKAYALISYGYSGTNKFDEWNAKIQDEAQKGLYIVNSFEKAHKWPLTKLYPVKCKNMKMPLVFFVGARKWTMSPYLMSIWTLCIRLGRNKWLPKGLLTLSHRNLVRQLAISSKVAKKSGSVDASQLSATLRKWDVFMGLYYKLFAGVDRKHHWSKTHLGGISDRPEGILRLMNGTTGYKELYKKYSELIKG